MSRCGVGVGVGGALEAAGAAGAAGVTAVAPTAGARAAGAPGTAALWLSLLFCSAVSLAWNSSDARMCREFFCDECLKSMAVMGFLSGPAIIYQRASLWCGHISDDLSHVHFDSLVGTVNMCAFVSTSSLTASLSSALVAAGAASIWLISAPPVAASAGARRRGVSQDRDREDGDREDGADEDGDRDDEDGDRDDEYGDREDGDREDRADEYGDREDGADEYGDREDGAGEYGDRDRADAGQREPGRDLAGVAGVVGSGVVGVGVAGAGAVRVCCGCNDQRTISWRMSASEYAVAPTTVSTVRVRAIRLSSDQWMARHSTTTRASEPTRTRSETPDIYTRRLFVEAGGRGVVKFARNLGRLMSVLRATSASDVRIATRQPN